jgi:hypothetical protein
MWVAFTILMVIWAVLKFVLHKGGYIHMFLIAALSILVVQLIADQKLRNYKRDSER